MSNMTRLWCLIWLDSNNFDFFHVQQKMFYVLNCFRPIFLPFNAVLDYFDFFHVWQKMWKWVKMKLKLISAKTEASVWAWLTLAKMDGFIHLGWLAGFSRGPNQSICYLIFIYASCAIHELCTFCWIRWRGILIYFHSVGKKYTRNWNQLERQQDSKSGL